MAVEASSTDSALGSDSVLVSTSLSSGAVRLWRCAEKLVGVRRPENKGRAGWDWTVAIANNGLICAVEIGPDGHLRVSWGSAQTWKMHARTVG